jgi:hypothetical protein
MGTTVARNHPSRVIDRITTEHAPAFRKVIRRLNVPADIRKSSRRRTAQQHCAGRFTIVRQAARDSASTVIEEEYMGGALGIGTPTYNPAQAGLFGNPSIGVSPGGVQTPQLLHTLQHLLQLQYAQQQQLQQLGQFVPQQLQLIQHLIQLVSQQQQPFQQWQPQLQPFAPIFQTPSFTGPSGWFGTQAAQQPIFGGQPGYVM